MKHRRTIWTGDNLEIMRRMKSASVDLIYMDPPFNSNRRYSAADDSEGAGSAFEDKWWNQEVRTDSAVAVLAGKSHSKSMMAYLSYMAAVLREAKRLLKKTGNTWLHCDDAASHYLKVLMDDIFGRKAYRNDICWQRHASNNSVTRRCGRILDHLLFYAMPEAAWNQKHHELSDEEKAKYRKSDEDGRLYKLDDLTSPDNKRNQFEWRGTTPRGDRGWSFSKEKMERMLSEGKIELGKNGKALLGGRVRYLDKNPGQKLQSLWTDIAYLGGTAKERKRTAYPTQKPVALLERIIEMCSNRNDLVLDPFCGSGTTLIAAERLGRQWTGIDASKAAVGIAKKRLSRETNLDVGDNRTLVPSGRVSFKKV